MRLSKIYTRTGDNGSTGLADGTRLAKDDPRIEAIGSVDELNSQIGLVLTESLPDALRQPLVAIQHTLFDLGGELSLPGRNILREHQISQLETWLDEANKDLPPLKEFILPGGSRAASQCHIARAVCRRAERRVVNLDNRAPSLAARYLNRLSDLLFVYSRAINRHDHHPETLWQQDKTTRD
ncbi:MAG: cob(I)yrinic acid a,c-diamide adenosyltransferase [Burkholderiales bacterium]